MVEAIFFSLLCLSFVFISALTSSSEIALFSLPSTKIKAYRSSSDPKKRAIAGLVLKPGELLVTVFFLNTVSNILLQNTFSHILGTRGGFIIKVTVPLLITLIFGEVIPKYIGIRKNITLAHLVVGIIGWANRTLGPLRQLITWITSYVSRAMFFFLRKEDTISEEELDHVLQTSRETGILNHDEAELVQGYIKLQAAQVKELMRPRQEILSFDIGESLTRLTHLFVEQEVTKVPVIDGELDSLLGVISAGQYFAHRSQITDSNSLIKHASKPFFVPENTPAKLLLRKLEQMDDPIAMVVDEYGTVSGLITKEDLVETVVGEITDRRDVKKLHTRASDDVIIASGKMELSELSDLLGIKLSSRNNYVTIGGWLTEQLGTIPVSGTHYETDELWLQVLAAEPRRVRRVYIRKKPKENQA